MASDPFSRLQKMLKKAEEREDKDDHLSEEERRKIVDLWLEVYREDAVAMRDFPKDRNIHEQFVWILYFA